MVLYLLPKANWAVAIWDLISHTDCLLCSVAVAGDKPRANYGSGMFMTVLPLVFVQAAHKSVRSSTLADAS